MKRIIIIFDTSLANWDAVAILGSV